MLSGDIRDFLQSTTTYNLQPTTYKVVANIPYYLTSRLIRLLLERQSRPELMVLMVQREVAERIIAKPPRMNLLALSVQFYGTPELVARVPAGAFQPPPKVESAIIKIRPYAYRHCAAAEGDRRSNLAAITNTAGLPRPRPTRARNDVRAQLFFTLVRAGFGQKRKTLLNNLTHGLKKPKAEIEALFKAAGIPPSSRAQTLTLLDWLRLVNTTQEHDAPPAAIDAD